MTPTIRWIAASLVAAAGLLVFLAADQPAPGDLMLRADAVDLSPLRAMPWDQLASKRISFGHQSVGDDIIAGIQAICRLEPSARLKIVGTDGAPSVDSAALVHWRVGRNGDALSKIEDFATRMEALGPGRVDIAFLKLCYIDVVAATPTESLFRRYKETFERLEAKLPATRFVHLTVPLTAPRTGIKPRLKRLLGGVPGDDADNRARQAFNALLRAEYHRRRPLVDIAAAESTLPDGTAVTSAIGADRFPCLARAYTTDGGHLNEVGQLTAARELLLGLAALVR